MPSRVCAGFAAARIGKWGTRDRHADYPRQDSPIESLSLPKVIADIALSERGLTLVTGTTGSGKSTTLAAMIDLINSSCQTKILTSRIRSSTFTPPRNLLSRRSEVEPIPRLSRQALRQALRQDPDVILIGELRDVETLRIALHAADTGHQVFSHRA